MVSDEFFLNNRLGTLGHGYCKLQNVIINLYWFLSVTAAAAAHRFFIYLLRICLFRCRTVTGTVTANTALASV
jgi:hypothetical protein